MIKLIQLNLNHCESAQDLLMQIVREENIDVAIIAEPYKNLDHPGWLTDESGTAVLWSCTGRPFEAVTGFSQDGYVGATLGGINFYSCYAPPSWTQESFEAMLDRLITQAKTHHSVAIAGDFNAWALEWGSKRTNKRGKSLLESFAALDLVLLNQGNQPTYSKGEASSIIDLTFVTSNLSYRIAEWEVSEKHVLSDHYAIKWSIAQKRRATGKQLTATKWKVSRFDKETFIVAFLDKIVNEEGKHAEEIAGDVISKTVDACDAAMPRRKYRKHSKSSVFWWNDDIAILRTECIRSRRKAKRARNTSCYDELQAKYKNARAKLSKTIKESKKLKWKELVEEVDKDPWGRPYMVIMSRLNNWRQPTCTKLMKTIVNTLFPRQEALTYTLNENNIEEFPRITPEELANACKKLHTKKAPGVDGIPNIALKLAIETSPDMFLSLYNKCLSEGCFPARWKVQRLVLLPKGNKPPEQPSSYRPLCILDSAGKILERIIHDRIENTIDSSLQCNQFGFRKARSTLDAISRVVNIARKATAGKRWVRGSKKYCLVVALDVRNAFNCARWDNICSALDSLGVPAYLMRMVKSYLENRRLKYETDEGMQEYVITGGVPQGSVLGPLLWNAMYDCLLRLNLPIGAELTAFADDVMISIVAKYLEEAHRIFQETFTAIQGWMKKAGLTLAEHKTEAMLITSRKTVEIMTLTIGAHTFTTQPTIKYLGVILDAKLSFKSHVEYAAKKASGAANLLSRLMPNVGGPRQSRRKLLAAVVTSVLLYAAPIWAEAMQLYKYRRKLGAPYRLIALRVACAFRTVSDKAICVIASLPPIHILVRERERTVRTAEKSRSQQHLENRDRSLAEWQEEWDVTTKGRWTHRLIAQISGWVNRKHGELNYYLTQMLSGHGCYRAYLHRFGHENSPYCTEGCNVLEDAEHVFFQCPSFTNERNELQKTLGKDISPESLVNDMLTSEKNWDAVSKFATQILKTLRQREQERRRQERAAIILSGIA